MRVLALVNEAYGAGGGIAQYNRDLFAALAHSGATATIEILPRIADDAAAKTPPGVRQLPARGGRTAYAIGCVLFALRARPQVVFCGHLFLSPLAAGIARWTKARLVIQLHGLEAWDKPWPAWRRAIERADLVLCVSRDTRERLLSWSDMTPERALVIGNTVGEAFSVEDGRDMRERLGLEGKRVLLSVGRLDERERYKGQDRVITALPALIAQGLDIIYLIAGDGDDQPRLEALARELGVAEHVRFLGHVPQADLPDLYRTADLFVLPSTREGFGIVFLEAMACGTPALGLAEGGAPDALGDGELGYLVKESELARVIGQALAEPPVDRRALSQKVAARYGRQAFAARIDGLLTRLERLGAAA